ncbi:MAG: hypothetical protein JXQ73_24285 [Phycisphaerae bacterium]|nr:hypothetical protein [Phycisphaerae bacterium]
MGCLLSGASDGSDVKTSTDWRDDVANIHVVRKINDSYARIPFSRQYEGVLDDRPVRLQWRIGPNLPVCWKGGVAGLIGDQIILTGGLWMPQRANLTYAFNIKDQTYNELPPSPVCPQYTQGTCHGQSLYVVGGRAAGRRVLKLTRDAAGKWTWTDMPQLPEPEGDGRWLATVGIVPGKWLFLVSGHPTGTPSEQRNRPQLPDYRLRLDAPVATWQPMAAYPGGTRALVMSAVIRGKLYVFGGSHPDPVMRANHLELAKKYKLRVPYNGVPNFRDAYCYDPEKNAWKPIRRTPFPVLAGYGVPLGERYILLMGSADYPTYRAGKAMDRKDPFWLGYGDQILCYDVERDNYAHVGVMPYGVATSPWVCDGKHLYGFGGEPAHGYNMNTENVLQIATIEPTP